MTERKINCTTQDAVEFAKTSLHLFFSPLNFILPIHSLSLVFFLRTYYACVFLLPGNRLAKLFAADPFAATQPYLAKC